MNRTIKVIGIDMAEPAPDKALGRLDCNVLEDIADRTSFDICLVNTDEGRNLASCLIDRMYSWRGYSAGQKIEENPYRVTLNATNKKGVVVGTITLGIDSPYGILADDLFKIEIDSFRSQGARVGEITKLAFDPTVRSNVALASLFHMSHIYARYVYNRTHVFIEVNPRHRIFYERKLGFQSLSEPRTNTRVNAPAHLLSISLDWIDEQVQKFGGTSSNPSSERSFYPLFFSPREEKGIIQRLKSREHQPWRNLK